MTPTTDHFRREFIDSPEGRLSVITAGDTGPPVLLLSGGGVDSATLSWRRLIPALAADHRVRALDWPKQGGSKPWHGLADHARLLRCITEVLDHAGWPSAALVGLSQGGAMTLAYAIEHPDRVDRLVAISPAGTLSFPPVVHQLLWLTAKIPLLSTTLPGLMVRNRRATAAFARKTLVAGPTPDFDGLVTEMMDEAVEGAGSSDWQNTSIGPFRMRVDLRPRLHEITSPALFIQGADDVGVPVKRTIAAAGAVPGSRLEVLPGVGHWANRQQPEEVNRLIMDFLDE